MQRNDPTGFEHSGSTDAPHRQTILIPGLLTNSWRTILRAFNTNIYQLTARGSTTTTNRTSIDALQDYGVSIEQRTSHTVSVDYERLTDNEGEPVNPLTGDLIQDLFDAVNTHLDAEALSVAPDLAVRSVTLRVTDERLAEVTPAQTTEFDLQFVADAAEGPLQERTELANRGRGLYDELGFNRTNLNLRSVIETATKYTTQSDGRFFHWHGPDDLRPRAPQRLATRINKHVLPEEYGILKPYQVVDDRTLELEEDTLEEITNTTTTDEEAQ